MRAKHNEVQTCEKNELGRIQVECYVCGNRNVFILGAVEEDDGNVLILCRKPCMELEKSGALRWRSAAWEPIITEKCFKSWLLGGQDTPPPRELTSKQILMLENGWKHNPALRLQDL